MDMRDDKIQTRRKFLKTTAAVGTVSYGSSSVLAGNNSELVEYIHFIKTNDVGPGEPERIPIYRTMQRNEWNRRKAATKAAQKIYDKIRNKWGSNPIRPFFAKLNNSPTRFGVKVHYNTYVDNRGTKRSPKPKLKKVKDELPDEITVEYDDKEFTSAVSVAESKSEEVGDCGESVDNMLGGSWDDIPGGIPCSVEAGDSNNLGTFCATFYETDYSAPGLILSGHVAEELKNDIDQTGRHVADVFDLTNNRRGVDWAYARLREGYSPEYYIADESNNKGNLDYTVDGIVTNDGLMADTDTSTIYHTQGRESRRQSGTLEEMGVNDRLRTGGQYNDVRSSHDVGKGDSGGPLFRTNQDNTGAYIAGVMYSKFTYRPFDNDCGNALSTTAETVEDDAPGFFH